MITQEELYFIYKNWKINQYLLSYRWGAFHDNARPEYYLAIQRGAVFTYRNKEIFFSHINKNKIANIKNYNSDCIFIDELILLWVNFLEYDSSIKYINDMNYNNDYLKNYILEKLQENISPNERIYNL